MAFFHRQLSLSTPEHSFFLLFLKHLNIFHQRGSRCSEVHARSSRTLLSGDCHGKLESPKVVDWMCSRSSLPMLSRYTRCQNSHWAVIVTLSPERLMRRACSAPSNRSTNPLGPSPSDLGGRVTVAPQDILGHFSSGRSMMGSRSSTEHERGSTSQSLTCRLL